MERAIYDFIQNHNEDPAAFTWTKSADEILAKIAGFCGDTLTAHGKG